MVRSRKITSGKQVGRSLVLLHKLQDHATIERVGGLFTHLHYYKAWYALYNGRSDCRQLTQVYTLQYFFIGPGYYVQKD